MKLCKIKVKGRMAPPLFLILLLTSALDAFAAGNFPADSSETRIYRMDAGAGSFTIHVHSGGLFSPFAHDHTVAIREFSGEIRLTPGSITPAVINVRIPADSITVVDEKHRGDIPDVQKNMDEKVLEVDKYPQIIFNSAVISAVKNQAGEYLLNVSGQLTLHGVTKRIEFDALVRETNGELHAKGTFFIRQTDYKMQPVSLFGGLVKVKNKVDLSFNVIAR